MNDDIGMFEPLKNAEPILMEQKEQENKQMDNLVMNQTMQADMFAQGPMGGGQMEQMRNAEMLVGDKQDTSTTVQMGVVMSETVRAAEIERETKEMEEQMRKQECLAKKSQESKNKHAQ